MTRGGGDTRKQVRHGDDPSGKKRRTSPGSATETGPFKVPVSTGTRPYTENRSGLFPAQWRMFTVTDFLFLSLPLESTDRWSMQERRGSLPEETFGEEVDETGGVRLSTTHESVQRKRV